MPRIQSLSFRQAANAPVTSEHFIVLVTIEHAVLVEPIRLSSDPTQRLSTDPLIYGTVSNGLEYQFALMGVSLPDREHGVPPRAGLVFENVTADIAEQLRSTSVPATITMQQ